MSGNIREFCTINGFSLFPNEPWPWQATATLWASIALIVWAFALPRIIRTIRGDK